MMILFYKVRCSYFEMGLLYTVYIHCTAVILRCSKITINLDFSGMREFRCKNEIIAICGTSRIPMYIRGHQCACSVET